LPQKASFLFISKVRELILKVVFGGGKARSLSPSDEGFAAKKADPKITLGF
jgi:hypothetical protein